MTAEFEADVSAADIIRFAEISGDWNPLHTDPEYASNTSHGRQVLHGAFSAGLFSRLAGAHLPGRKCLLLGMRLRFVMPIYPPVRLRVSGHLVAGSPTRGTVEATVADAEDGRTFVEGSYDFCLHESGQQATSVADEKPRVNSAIEEAVLVTGATGGLGDALMKRLGSSAIGFSRTAARGFVSLDDDAGLVRALDGRSIKGIVQCGWPAPDNVRLLKLEDPKKNIDHHVASPLHEAIRLAQLLADNGAVGATLVLVGSAWANPGRHAWRAPLYGIAKSMVPTLTNVLALELANADMRSVAVVFDVLDGGMNKAMSPRQSAIHSDRVPAGTLPGLDMAASQIEWVLGNPGFLVSGATLSLTGGAVP